MLSWFELLYSVNPYSGCSFFVASLTDVAQHLLPVGPQHANIYGIDTIVELHGLV